jgi:hypothetical protein
VNALHEYFIARPAELDRLDLAKSPVAQLPPDSAAELPGVDPTVVLLSLVEVLTIRNFDELLSQVHDELVFDGGDDGPWVVAIDQSVVDAIRGADGDPEMEWDDAVAQWAVVVAEELGDPDETGLIEITSELRRLAGSTGADQRLYCWTS